MSDDLPLTVSQVCRSLPGARGARHVTPSTVTRWILTGCPSRSGQRVRLPATRAGGRWLIRPADLDTFFATLAGEIDPDPVPPTPTAVTSRRASERARRELETRGS
jgi:hypothetical protein